MSFRLGHFDVSMFSRTAQKIQLSHSPLRLFFYFLSQKFDLLNIPKYTQLVMTLWNNCMRLNTRVLNRLYTCPCNPKLWWTSLILSFMGFSLSFVHLLFKSRSYLKNNYKLWNLSSCWYKIFLINYHDRKKILDTYVCVCASNSPRKGRETIVNILISSQ